LKLLIDADTWQIWKQNKTYILDFLLPLLKKTFPRHCTWSLQPKLKSSALGL